MEEQDSIENNGDDEEFIVEEEYEFNDEFEPEEFNHDQLVDMGDENNENLANQSNANYYLHIDNNSTEKQDNDILELPSPDQLDQVDVDILNEQIPQLMDFLDGEHDPNENPIVADAPALPENEINQSPPPQRDFRAFPFQEDSEEELETSMYTESCLIKFLIKDENKAVVTADKFSVARGSQYLANLVHNYRRPITVNHISSDSLQKMITFISSKKIVLRMNNVISIMQKAVVFDMNVLEKICINFLEKAINIENVCYFFDQAVKYKNSFLSNVCARYINENRIYVIHTEKIMEMHVESIQKLIALVDPFEGSDHFLFVYMLTWARRKCKDHPQSVAALKKTIGDRIELINFNNTTLEQFLNCYDEIKEFFDDELAYNQIIPQILSSIRQKERLKDVDLSISRRKSFQKTPSLFQSEAFQIRASLPVYLYGFSLYNKERFCMFDLTLLNDDMINPCKTLESTSYSNKHFFMYHIMLKEPLLIKSNRIYNFLYCRKYSNDSFVKLREFDLSFIDVPYSLGKDVKFYKLKKSRLIDIIYQCT